MTQMQALLNLLEADKKHRQASQAFNEWVASAKAIVQQIRNWLSVARKRGLLEIEVGKLTLLDDEAGEYELPELVIRTATHKIWVRPTARKTAIGDGHVEVWSSGADARLVRFAEDGRTIWRIADDRKPEKWDEANEERFASLLKKLLES